MPDPEPATGSRAVIVSVPGCAPLGDALAKQLGAEVASGEIRRFPDGEWYVRVDTPLGDREVIIAASLDRADEKFLPLAFLAATARDLGARRVGLVAPYLAFMRQDSRFADGEGITSSYFAAILSRTVDWLVTVDPHLHRWRALEEIYAIPCRTARAAPHIAAWIRDHVPNPLLVGPDAESAQWVAAVARCADAPHLILEKVRHGDRDVDVSVPEVEPYRDRAPVLIDDIISTGRTMVEPVRHLLAAGMKPPVCIGIHAVFAGDAEAALRDAGAARIVTCNTIAHASNAIDVVECVSREIQALLAD